MDHNDELNQNSENPTGPGGYMKLAGIEDGEYDALADLFLGESELAPEPFSNTGTDAVDKPLPSAPTAPVRLAQPAGGDFKLPQSPVEVMTPVDEYEDREPAIGSMPSIEAVLLGHLPVRASLWVRQYACSTARRRDEIVALVRAAAGSTSVDLISGSHQIDSAVCGSLHEALQRVNTIADRVILRVDETTEPDLLDREEIDEITILTGADEAAIVSSYRLIKTLTSVWDADEVIGAPHLRLAVMGATGQQVADASTKLSRAVDAFLDRPIEIVDAAGRIDATGTTNIFRDTVAHQVTTILDDLIEIGCGIPHLDGWQERESLAGLVEDESIAAAVSPDTGPVAQTVFVDTNPVAKPIDKPIAKAAAPVLTGLGSMIQGLARLETRCPFALDVELCVDTSGSLHLVAGDEHDGPMARLETVRAWVRDHLPLILRAETTLAMPSADDRSSEIGLHLISSDPQTLRGLIDSPVRMYALAEVTVGGQQAKIATPIN